MSQQSNAVGVKICGLKTADMVDAALDAGADYIGLVFFGKSPRAVDIAIAQPLARRVQARGADVVALLVDADDELIDAIVAEVAPNILQLHGHETPGRVAEIRARVGQQVWKVLSVETAADVANAAPYRTVADRIMFDAKMPKDSVLPGGNGVAFDWSLLAGVSDRTFVLAGGLTPSTVADAARRTQAAVVDVSSGVESAPGVKDAARIAAFIHAAKSARS
jgi:phosphoribosylanthranilate isomerase